MKFIKSLAADTYYHTRDQKEGVSAFFEKRKPNFKANLDDNPPPSVPWWTEVDTGRNPKAKAPSKL